jgi:exopolysaccharide biosynthesis protein
MTYAVQGGPLLVRKGDVLFETENLSDGVVSRRHPRTAIGLTGSGQWFFFVGDGRNAVHSVGFTLAETADILKKNGAAYALNLDGGGSSSIFLGGRVVNALSDGRERPVSYGIGAFRRGVNK